ncbi:MAG TPA: hypothetical protein VKA60_11555 [Blastocatellia bacterium]|nr:hypothetical protein [Blastocatellia bacterium]
MRRQLIVQATAVMAIFLVAVVALAQDYEIHLSRLSKVGAKHHLNATGSHAEYIEVTSGKRALRTTDEKFTYQLSADVTVLETDGKGHPTSESLVVVNSKLMKDGAERTFLPPGLVLVAAVEDGKTVFKMDGKPLDKETSKVLSSAISLYTGGLDDEEIFGTRSRKRVGESWPINPDAAVAMLKELGAQGKKEDVTGTMTLEKVEGGHLFLHGSTTIKPLEMPLPSEFKPEGGELQGEFSGRFPMKDSDGSLRQTLKARITLAARRAATGSTPEIRMTAFFESSDEEEITPLTGEEKKAAK